VKNPLFRSKSYISPRKLAIKRNTGPYTPSLPARRVGSVFLLGISVCSWSGERCRQGSNLP
jgi:hypothetical protein